MNLALEPLGTLTVHTGGGSWNFGDGPLGGRSCTAFERVVWTNHRFTATSMWANGTYRNGPEMAEPNIRVMFRCDDDSLFYLEYLARVHLPTHTRGASPSLLRGALEVPETNERLAWLNHTAIVGRGSLDLGASTMTYDIGVLRWPDDRGPR